MLTQISGLYVYVHSLHIHMYDTVQIHMTQFLQNCVKANFAAVGQMN